ncbi:hypothetical protein H6G54_17645 [Anabaena cylindrica FACHB-243]|uniref:Uncharacterized protein n=1 Tax=Anabaena cylindrica (strain ATCC 27899 / PCC 7122) TaxID=272123 RepID=K9ZK35_ANACC|nr:MULTISPECIES: hypothetical protein [Anabaena]AFZ58907.1 hypothetical protein Anacy_3510 [Anabaena cylindrica PCC 7122]MBD2419491.1 hypothetical protein [Anabaena cylindrica FACHB-243]MBY5283982.1 hypothetical protein [Anabaena sp. CCAP 1446/1C]MBY5310808.1 hypothetical protein [Anabaena sp. CCAP 1446/1C]MCM2408326.1 hypothetical protein [Anabaena sp. CCAP 1446/1C]
MAKNGVAAYSNSWKTDSFSTKDKIIDLQLQHSFWSHTTVVDNGSFIVANVTVKNTGNIALKDVQVYVDVDDDSALFDAHITNSNGEIIDSNAPVLNFGYLAPGVSSTQISYWWTVKPRFPEAEGSVTKTATFNLYPVFTADFKQSGQAFQSYSQLDKA